MNVPLINKELLHYINKDVFITMLNIPLFESFSNSIQLDDGNIALIKDRIYMLLKLPHREFWCHVLFDRSVLQSLQSFFLYAKRPHELLLTKSSLTHPEKDVYKLYYRLIIRISTHKEVDIPEFSQTNFGNLIYDNYIIDVPTMFDICSIFGEENSEIIGKLLCGVLTCQNLYTTDVHNYIGNTINLLNDKIKNIASNGFAITNESTKTKVNQHLLKKSSPKNAEDVDLLYYVIDFSRTWSIFLHCIEPKREFFDLLIETQFQKIIEKLFEKIVPLTQLKFDKFETKEPEIIKQLLSVVCFYLIDVWRTIFKRVYIDKLIDGNTRSSEENYTLIGECVSMISGCQEHSTFADAMYLVYPLEDDLNLIFQAIVSDKNEYYSEYVNETLDGIKKAIKSRTTLFSRNSFEMNSLSSSLPISDMDACGNNSDISQVMDIFQELSAQDIHTYMKSYSCTSECMLESLLEGAIDVAFVKDLSAKCVSDQHFVESEEDFFVDSILSNHRNIYDGDEFDTGKIKASQIHQGKRQNNYNPIVDEELRKMIQNIVVRQNEEDDEKPIDNENSLYNDEFDDVYGISHDGIVNEKNSEEVVVEKIPGPSSGRSVTETATPQQTENTVNGSGPQRAHRLQNKSQGNNPVAVASVKEVVEPIIMEPSDVRYSKYSKNMAQKKRFQDHQPQNGGNRNHGRPGSHANMPDKVKKDHRPKGARNTED